WRRRIFRTKSLTMTSKKFSKDPRSFGYIKAIYDRHATIPFPESLIALGPEPLEEGIFLYCARRFRDRFGWDDVEETRRKNCRSGPPVQGAQKTTVAPTRMRMETLTRQTRMEALSRRLWMEAKKIPRVPPTPMMSMETPIMIRTLMKAKRVNLYCHFVSISRPFNSFSRLPVSLLYPDRGSCAWSSVQGECFWCVVTLCKRFKDRVLELKDPIRGVAPLVSAVRKVQVSANCLTVLHPDCLQLCLQAKCYKAGYDEMNGIGLKRFQKTSELHYNPYYEVGNRYKDGKISELEAVVVAQSSDLEQDKDTGLVKQAVSSLYKRNILGLTHKYLTLSLQDIVNMMVQTANAKEAETHVIQMIQDGQIHALINQKDGVVRLLEDPEQYKTSEMIEVMVSVIQRTIGLSKNLLAMDESLSCDPLYLGKVPPLSLPCEAYFQDTVSQSSVREDQLVVLFQTWDILTFEIWISTKIGDDPNAVSWNNKFFLSANIKQLIHPQWQFPASASFFIDEEKKVAVVFDKDTDIRNPTREVAYIIGVDGSLKEAADVRECADRHCDAFLCSYVPSLVQLN
ncbi:unnamed protein product, partial [Brassica oleracea]